MLTKIGFLVALLPAVVDADERGSFVSLDRADRDSFVSVGLAGSFGSGDGLGGDGFALRANVYARYAGAEGGGVYAQIAISGAQGFMSWSEGASDLELGGLFISHLDDVDIIWRFGVGLPTATSDDTGTQANLAAFADRIVDFPLIYPDIVWLRPGVAIRFGNASFFAQIDGGIDFPIAKEDSDYDASAMGHLNGGLGINQGSIAFTVELANDIFGTSQMLHSVAASLRWRSSAAQPFIGGGFAFGDNFPSRLSFICGVQARL